jgi:hypothetical protein
MVASCEAAVAMLCLHRFGRLPFTEISPFAPFGAGILSPVHLTERKPAIPASHNHY